MAYALRCIGWGLVVAGTVHSAIIHDTAWSFVVAAVVFSIENVVREQRK